MKFNSVKKSLAPPMIAMFVNLKLDKKWHGSLLEKVCRKTAHPVVYEIHSPFMRSWDIIQEVGNSSP